VGGLSCFALAKRYNKDIHTLVDDIDNEGGSE